jgi:hypothetical protein
LRIYVDTSVFVAALTREAATSRVQVWLSEQPAGRLLSSDWVATEFSAALSIKLRMGDIDSAIRSAALAKLVRLSRIALDVRPIRRKHFRAAAGLAERYEIGLRAGDALHLAVAVAEGAEIATLDRRLASAASALGLGGLMI